MRGNKHRSKTLSLLEFTVANSPQANPENVKRSLLCERTNRPGLIFLGLECPLVNQLLENACGHIQNSKQHFQPDDGVFRTKRKSALSNLFKSKQLKPNNSILHAFNKQNFTYVLKPLLKNAQQEIICEKTLGSKTNISC